MKRKQWLSIFLALALLLSLLGGCNKPQSAPDGSGSGNAGGEEKKDTLVIAMTGNPTSLDPAGKNDGASMAVKRQMYDGLTELDPDMKEASPCLAESWEYQDDTTLIFHLRQGVKFHDGSELTAEDVAFSIQRAYDAGFATAYMGAFDLEKSEAVDTYTYKLVTKYPSGTVLNVLAYPCLFITSKAAVEALGEDTATQCPGTGPYKFVDWVQGDSLRLTRFEDYWGTNEGADHLLFRVIAETSSRVIEVETGGADIAYDVTALDIERYQNDEAITTYRKPTTTLIYMGMNCSKAPFDDVRVRQAVSHCVNREDLVNMVYAGQGQAASSVVTASLYGYSDQVKLPEYNPEKAKELLAQAGYPDGLETTIWCRDQQIFMDAAEVLANQLEAGGIHANIKVIEWASLLTSLENKELDLYLLSLGVATGDAGDGLYRYFWSENPFSSNTAFFQDATMDQMITAANQEVDSAKRMELLRDAQQYAADNGPWAPLVDLESLFLSTSKVRNFQVYASTYQCFKDVYAVK